MGKIDYKAIYNKNRTDWKELTNNPHKYEALLAGHYSDSNHFVYELLQNAEDAGASSVAIEYYEDKFVFYHDGKPFDENDVRGVSSMLMGTKRKDDAQTIGRFGMGFKSVFKYTSQPKIYSDSEAFEINRYLLPVEIEEGWDFESEKKRISYKISDKWSIAPFAGAEHLTKIVIPFKKYGEDMEFEAISGEDVEDKLLELDGEILLFLSHVKRLFWINKESKDYGLITLGRDEKDDRRVYCRIEKNENKEESSYLVFKETFDHPDMKGAEVSVAYKLNRRGDNINAVEDSDIYVYFPTKENTNLPFLIHGSFETAVSREKLMAPSSFNSDLFERLGDLIAQSMEELAKRKLITQAFIRNVVLVAFGEEDMTFFSGGRNRTIPRIKEKVTRAFSEKGLIPNRKGEYKHPDELKLPVPFRMADFVDDPLIGSAFEEGIDFVAFGSENEKNFGSYFKWLSNDLGIGIYRLSSLARSLSNIPEMEIKNPGELYASLKEFYKFLTEQERTRYQQIRNPKFMNSLYVNEIQKDADDAWEELKKAPIILNSQNKLVPAKTDDKPSVYLASLSSHRSVLKSQLVNEEIAKEFENLLSDGFELIEFDDFLYVRDNIVKKYEEQTLQARIKNQDNFAKEYVNDVRLLLDLMDQTGDTYRVTDMVKEVNIIKVRNAPGDDEWHLCKPGECFVPKSKEGIDLEIYYATRPYDGLEDDEIGDPHNWHSDDFFLIDEDFYEENDFEIDDLKKFGLIISPVHDGKRQDLSGDGNNYWKAIGAFCPNIRIDMIDRNMTFIENNSEMVMAHKKSAEMLRLLLAIANKLQGKKKLTKTRERESDLISTPVLQRSIKLRRWLFDRNMRIATPTEISKYDLNPNLYGKPDDANKEKYEILGFRIKEDDLAEDTLKKIQELNKSEQERVFRQLAKDLGINVSDSDTASDRDEDDDDSDFFDPSQPMDEDFPVSKVRNMEYLRRHVREQFACADPVTYEKVLRQIRVSKDAKADRYYAIGMYTNSNNVLICQMCREQIRSGQDRDYSANVCQIANFGIEMPQLNLCLCARCQAKYRNFSKGDKDEFRNMIKEGLQGIDADEEADEYSLECSRGGQEVTIHFTQTHIAEIQEILDLLEEYGTPDSQPSF